MSPHHCQVCGRRKPLRKDGLIIHHHYQGNVCRGVGALPYEQDDSALRAARAHWEAETTRMLERQFDHARRRLNEPLPSWHFSSLAKAASEAARLGTRLYRRTYGLKPIKADAQVAA